MVERQEQSKNENLSDAMLLSFLEGKFSLHSNANLPAYFLGVFSVVPLLPSVPVMYDNHCSNEVYHFPGGQHMNVVSAIVSTIPIPMTKISND